MSAHVYAWLVSRRRGATFVEYALLAALAVILFFVFRDNLQAIIDTLMQRLRSVISSV